MKSLFQEFLFLRQKRVGWRLSQRVVIAEIFSLFAISIYVTTNIWGGSLLIQYKHNTFGTPIFCRSVSVMFTNLSIVI